jgi:hypothetical protein
MIHSQADFLGGSDESPGTDVPTVSLWGKLQHFQQMEPLQIRAVVVVQLFGEKQTEVFVAPR